MIMWNKPVAVLVFLFSMIAHAGNNLDAATPCQNNAALFDEKAITEARTEDYMEFCRNIVGQVGERVCERVGEGDKAITWRYETKDKKALTWITSTSGFDEYFPPFFAELMQFAGDPPESKILVAVKTWESVGIATSRWTLYLIDTDSRLEPEPEMVVDNFGEMSGFYRFPGTDGCFLFNAHWVNDSEPKRGQGTYVLGEWMRLSGNQFVPAIDMPLIRRRYLSSFESERYKNDYKKGPLKWFVTAGTHPIRRKTVGKEMP